jgi:hypothetical protein
LVAPAPDGTLGIGQRLRLSRSTRWTTSTIIAMHAQAMASARRDCGGRRGRLLVEDAYEVDRVDPIANVEQASTICRPSAGPPVRGRPAGSVGCGLSESLWL